LSREAARAADSRHVLAVFAHRASTALACFARFLARELVRDAGFMCCFSATRGNLALFVRR